MTTVSRQRALEVSPALWHRHGIPKSEFSMRQIAIAAAAATLLGLPAAAQEAPTCALPADRYDMTAAQIDAMYDCMSGYMIEGYQSQGAEVAMAYRDWTQASIRPAVAGVHGERFLNTFVN